MPRLDTDVVKVCKQFYACWSGFRVPPRMTANPLILYHLATLALGWRQIPDPVLRKVSELGGLSTLSTGIKTAGRGMRAWECVPVMTTGLTDHVSVERQLLYYEVSEF